MPDSDAVKILLVDDQPAKLLSYEVILHELGESLLKASSARAALDLLLKHDVAVVLADVCMPEFDGFEMAKMLREHPRYESTAVIFISAVHLSDEDRARAYELGAVDYVSVPVVPEILRAKVKVFVELFRKTRQLELLNSSLEQHVRERTIELEAANCQLRESEERLRLASEAAEFGTYDYNQATGQIHCSNHLKRLLGSSMSGDMSLNAFLELVHPNDKAAVRDAMASPGGDGYAPHEIEFRSAAAPGVRWLLDRGRSLQVNSVSDRPQVRTMGTILDITTRKKLEERQKLLIAELDHRVKNVMANVTAMAKLSGCRARSVDEFVVALEGRLQSMASAHSLLRRSDWDSADLAELATAVLAPFRSQHGENIILCGDRVSLLPKTTQDFALVLHELATNAVKHGALSKPDGKVSLSWVVDPHSGKTSVVWRESGGPIVRDPDKRGLGLSIIQSAFNADRIKVDCTFAATGLVCTIEGDLCGLGSVSSSSAFVAPSSQEPASDHLIVSTRRLRILLVEDEPLVAMYLQSELELNGHVVLGPAGTLSEGLVLAETAEFDVALLDINLGRETSAEIAALLDTRGIPFAFSTGYSDGSKLPESLRRYPRIAKPYHSQDILRLIMDLVCGKQMVRDAAV